MAGWDDGIGVKVRGWLLGMCWQTDLTSAQPELFLWAMMPAAMFCCGALIPTAMSMASTGPFDSMMCFPVSPLSGSQGPGPSQVDRTILCDGFCGS